MDSAEAVVNKSGENCIQVGLRRCSEGLLIKAWAQQKVEDFCRSLGTGEKIDVQTIGRHWTPVGKDADARLLVYEMSQPVGVLHLESHGFSFRIDRPGYPLVETPDNLEVEPGESAASYRNRKAKGETLNMSFLRFAGLSGESGVSFVVKGVYTREGIDQLAARVEQAGNRFYKEFLKPYHVIVTVSTMPIPDNF